MEKVINMDANPNNWQAFPVAKESDISEIIKDLKHRKHGGPDGIPSIFISKQILRTHF